MVQVRKSFLGIPYYKNGKRLILLYFYLYCLEFHWTCFLFVVALEILNRGLATVYQGDEKLYKDCIDEMIKTEKIAQLWRR